jgi:hypothetical protein
MLVGVMCANSLFTIQREGCIVFLVLVICLYNCGEKGHGVTWQLRFDELARFSSSPRLEVRGRLVLSRGPD